MEARAENKRLEREIQNATKRSRGDQSWQDGQAMPTRQRVWQSQIWNSMSLYEPATGAPGCWLRSRQQRPNNMLATGTPYIDRYTRNIMVHHQTQLNVIDHVTMSATKEVRIVVPLSRKRSFKPVSCMPFVAT